MKLTRRDAVIALSTLGLTSAAWLADHPREGAVSSAEADALVALGETLYPASVEPSRSFVETYVAGQREIDPDHAANVAAAVNTVRQECRLVTGVDLPALSRERRGDVLRSTGADRAEPDPDGTDAERIRYYVVNNLLYACMPGERQEGWDQRAGGSTDGGTGG